jgi:hypothetical protein
LLSRPGATAARRPLRSAAGRGLLRLAVAAAAGAVAVALAPVTLVAVTTFWSAWWRGTPPRRVFSAALWCLPMVTAWLVAVTAWPAPAAGAGAPGPVPGRRGGGPPGYPAGAGPGAVWYRVLAAPYRAQDAMWRLAAHGHLVAATVAIAPAAVPAGIVAGGACWSYRRLRMRTGAGGLTPVAPAAFDARQWRHQVRTARALIAAPGSLPLLTRGGHVVAGATIRAVGHRTGRAASLPYERLRAHQVVIGSTGTGKTTLLLRLWAGFMAAGLRRYAAGSGRRPLLVVLDCKGGASSRKVADRTRRVLRDAGARSTAIWPDEAALSLWSLPPDRLVTALLDLIEHGTGGAAYYADIMESLVTLAVCAPCGPPASSGDFVARLDADWLAAVYGAAGDADAVTAVRAARKALDDVRLRFRALWRRLGPGLDAPGFGATGFGATGSFGSADAWYCILEGTAEVSVAEAQARALADLLAFFALDADREILLCVDEFSAVSRRLPISRLYERARSLGLAVQVSAQSWEGLAATEDERQRVAATAEGGIWLLRTPRPGPVAELAGHATAVDTTRRFAGPGAWGDDGLSRTRLAPVLDGDLIRRLDVGQVCYVYRGGVTYLQIKRLTGQQAAIGRGASPPAAPVAGDAASAAAGPATVPRPAPGPAHGPAAALAPPDAGEVLDEAFGKRRE